MTTVRDTVDQYREAGLTVWGITSSPPAIISAWAREYHFGVPILSDYDRSVSEAYVGVYQPEERLSLALATKRGLVSISRDGVVRYVLVMDESALVPTEAEAAEAIAAAAG